MVAIARAMVSGPRLLLMDEPSLGLAPIVVADVFRLTKEINAMGIAILMVEQNAPPGAEGSGRRVPAGDRTRRRFRPRAGDRSTRQREGRVPRRFGLRDSGMDLFLQQVCNGLVIGSTYAIVALGFALAFSVLRVVHFAHPDIFMIGMFSGLVAANAVPGLAL
jgi:hypothetical protein